MTIVLTEETHAALVKMAEKESRPVAQMARVIVERAVNLDEATTVPNANPVHGG
jgi:hypothetical protein